MFVFFQKQEKSNNIYKNNIDLNLLAHFFLLLFCLEGFPVSRFVSWCPLQASNSPKRARLNTRWRTTVGKPWLALRLLSSRASFVLFKLWKSLPTRLPTFFLSDCVTMPWTGHDVLDTFSSLDV
jgi:hypothetical protein